MHGYKTQPAFTLYVFVAFIYRELSGYNFLEFKTTLTYNFRKILIHI